MKREYAEWIIGVIIDRATENKIELSGAELDALKTAKDSMVPIDIIERNRERITFERVIRHVLRIVDEEMDTTHPFEDILADIRKRISELKDGAINDEILS